jgi:hypothetical protein
MDSDENSLTGCAASIRMLVVMAPVTPKVGSLFVRQLHVPFQYGYRDFRLNNIINRKKRKAHPKEQRKQNQIQSFKNEAKEKENQTQS